MRLWLSYIATLWCWKCPSFVCTMLEVLLFLPCVYHVGGVPPLCVPCWRCCCFSSVCTMLEVFLLCVYHVGGVGVPPLCCVPYWRCCYPSFVYSCWKCCLVNIFIVFCIFIPRFNFKDELLTTPSDLLT